MPIWCLSKDIFEAITLIEYLLFENATIIDRIELLDNIKKFHVHFTR